jgi:hypothetical protein
LCELTLRLHRLFSSNERISYIGNSHISRKISSKFSPKSLFSYAGKVAKIGKY